MAAVQRLGRSSGPGRRGRGAADVDGVAIDSDIAALSRALESAGVAPVRPPAEPFDLGPLAEAIAPLTLPADLVRFWELVDPYELAVEYAQDFLQPRHALDEWRLFQSEDLGPEPRCLLPIASAGLWKLSIELDHPKHGVGGAIFDWAADHSEATLHAVSLPARLRWLTMAIEADPSEWSFRESPGRGRILMLGEDVEAEFCAERVSHPVYGSETLFARNRGQWPQSWQRKER